MTGAKQRTKLKQRLLSISKRSSRNWVNCEALGGQELRPESERDHVGVSFGRDAPSRHSTRVTPPLPG